MLETLQPTPSEETPTDGHVPSPPSERGGWLAALVLAAVGVAVLVGALVGVGGGSGAAPPRTAPPAVPAAAVTPALGVAQSASILSGRRGHLRGSAAIIARPTSAQQRAEATRLVDQTQTHISTRWMEGFYPIYAVAQRTFGVNWLLLASIHRQESAFSTAPSTYQGLNFAGCCGGPMQFNVTNGPVTTWRLVESSYRYGERPASYDHMTATHPSLYDDFDSIMAAAHLLSADGAEMALNGAAWGAAYDYYGHDATGVSYADQVLARAIGWSQRGFCINCGVSPTLIEAVDGAYGAPVLAGLSTASAAGAHRTRK
jgi:hypothetical protein